MHRTLAAAALEHAAKPRLARELIFWFSIGLLVVNCFVLLSGGMHQLSGKFAFWLYRDYEMPSRILTTVLRWLPTAVFYGLAILITVGKLRSAVAKAASWFCDRSRVTAAGILTGVISYGIAAVGASLAGMTWLLPSALWTFALICFSAWLAPSVIPRQNNSKMNLGFKKVEME